MAEAEEPKAKRLKSDPPIEEHPTNELDAAYSADFLNSLIHPLLNQPARPSKASVGLRVIPAGSTENPKANISIRIGNVDTPPDVAKEELPLALDDSRRKYASGIPGIRLTHPGGALEGGPGRYHTEQESTEENCEDPLSRFPAAVRAFLREHDISNTEQLRELVKREQQKNIEDLRKRMGDRAQARKKNEEVEGKLEEMTAEREMERKVHEKARKGNNDK